MVNIKKTLERFGAHSFLLPVFFVAHSYLQYFGLVSAITAVKVLAETEVLFVVLFVILFVVTRNNNRSTQITTLTGFIFLFYGTIRDFLKMIPAFHFISRYSVLLPAVVILFVLGVKTALKKRDFSRANLFLNTLLMLFLLNEGIMLLYSSSAVYMQRNQLVNNDRFRLDSIHAANQRPDIYFLVFDSYPGTGFLKTYLHYDNTAFDSALNRRGFYIVNRSSSNYNRTAFSMAATLNFEYLRNIPDHSPLEPKHYNQASLSIDRAIVPAAFKRLGYHICNLSFFDVAATPPIFKENFLVLPEKQMLLYNTLTESLNRDVMWHLNALFDKTGMGQSLEDRQGNFVTENEKKRIYNDKVIDSLKRIPLAFAGGPKFIYAHLYLPHPPFFYDSTGKRIPVSLNGIEKAMEDKNAFISYLQYTNKTIQDIIKAILDNNHSEPVIVVQSDHGYRDFRKDFVNPREYVKNYCAFYFPDKDYSTLYDSISNINTFPILFNKYFNTHIVLQPDTSTFLPY